MANFVGENLHALDATLKLNKVMIIGVSQGKINFGTIHEEWIKRKINLNNEHAHRVIRL